jgi:hypothetical protein
MVFLVATTSLGLVTPRHLTTTNLNYSFDQITLSELPKSGGSDFFVGSLGFFWVLVRSFVILNGVKNLSVCNKGGALPEILRFAQDDMDVGFGGFGGFWWVFVGSGEFLSAATLPIELIEPIDLSPPECSVRGNAPHRTHGTHRPHRLQSALPLR